MIGGNPAISWLTIPFSPIRACRAWPIGGERHRLPFDTKEADFDTIDRAAVSGGERRAPLLAACALWHSADEDLRRKHRMRAPSPERSPRIARHPPATTTRSGK
jgi:hypothetical protein